MLSLAKRNVAVYIPTTTCTRPSSKIFEFFGISPSATPSSSLRQLLNGQGIRRSTPVIVDEAAIDEDVMKHPHVQEKGWSHSEAYKDHGTGRKLGCFKAFIKGFGPIWFAIPSTAGLIGILLRQILLHVLIPSDLVHTNTSMTPNNTTGIDIKGSILNSTRPFRGQIALQTTSTVFFFIDLVLFTIFSLALFLRLIWFRRSACREVFGPGHHKHDHTLATGVDDLPIGNIAHSPKHNSNLSGNDTGYLPLWPTTWLTLVAFAVAIIPEIEADPSSNISTTKLTYLAYITWWIGAAWTIIATISTLTAVILPPSSPPNYPYKPQRISPSLLFAPFSLATISMIGSLLVSNLLIASQASSTPTNNASTALSLPTLATVPVIISSFCAIGAALFLALILYPVLLFQQFFTPGQGTHITNTQSPTSTELALTLFFFIGPVSQCAAGLQLLGGALSAIPGGGDKEGTSGNGSGGYDISGAAFLTNTAPTLISVPCILLALFLLGIAVVWFLLALVVMGCAAVRRELRWSMDWHGVILPLAGLGLCTLMFGAELDSGFFRVVACVFLVVVVVGLLVNIGFTVWFVVKGGV